MNPNKQRAGQLGGLSTLEKYGRNFFIQNGVKGGKQGGRPRLPTLEQLRQQAALESEKEEPYLPGVLARTNTTRLYRLRISAGGSQVWATANFPQKGEQWQSKYHGDKN